MQDAAAAIHEPAMLSPRHVFLRWERLRIPYNLALTAVALYAGVMSSTQSRLTDPGFLLFLISRVLLANVCFTAGPCVESYVMWLGQRPVPWIRPLLFVLGTLLAAFLAALSILFFALRGLD